MCLHIKIFGKGPTLYITDITEGRVGLVYAYFMALILFFFFLLHNLAYAVENKF